MTVDVKHFLCRESLALCAHPHTCWPLEPAVVVKSHHLCNALLLHQH
jgi:hypothetical protein